MLEYFYRSIRDKKVRRFAKRKPGSVAVVTNASREDLSEIANMASLQVNDLVDIFDTQEIPRLEQTGKTSILIVRIPVSFETDEASTQLLMLVYHKKSLFILAAGELKWLKDLLTKADKIATTQPAKMLIYLLLHISNEYSLRVNKVFRLVEGVRKKLLNASNNDIETLIVYEAILNDYLSALVPMQLMYQRIISGKFIPLYAEDEALFEDLINSISQSVEVCKVSMKNIISLRDSFQIVVTNRLNHTVKILTSATILLTIPTLVSSVYGMNVKLPGAGEPNFFWWLSLGVGVVVLATWWWFRKKRWL